MAARDQRPNRNDPWNINVYESARVASSVDTSRSKLIKPSSPSHEPDKMRVRRMEDFYRSLRKDPEWLEQSVPASELRNPSCFPTFAIAHGLYLYARDVIDSFEVKTINRYDPPLLYWVLASYQTIGSFSTTDLNEDEAERSYEFAHYLLEKGADPNAIFMVPYSQFDQNWEDHQSGDAAVTLIHHALGVMINCGSPNVNFIATLHMINILLENGATFTTPLYHNYWMRYNNNALNRSPIQFLIDTVSEFQKYNDLSSLAPIFQGEAAKFLADQIKANLDQTCDYFTLGEIGKLLCKTVKSFLDHGADPNAVDDHGVDVLSSIMSACPYHVVEYALEKGAQISPTLLQNNGSPVRTHGILLEDRWRRPECYTPEAREIVRKHMPHWVEPVDEKPVEDEPTEDELVEETSNVGGWVARIGSLIGWSS
jgi:hypothetical protein